MTTLKPLLTQDLKLVGTQYSLKIKGKGPMDLFLLDNYLLKVSTVVVESTAQVSTTTVVLSVVDGVSVVGVDVHAVKAMVNIVAIAKIAFFIFVCFSF
jgi:hypothetical protein